MGNLSDATNLLNDLSANEPQKPLGHNNNNDMSVSDNNGNEIKLSENYDSLSKKTQ